MGARTSSLTAPTRASAGLVRALRAGTRSSESLFRSWSLPRRRPASSKTSALTLLYHSLTYLLTLVKTRVLWSALPREAPANHPVHHLSIACRKIPIFTPAFSLQLRAWHLLSCIHACYRQARAVALLYYIATPDRMQQNSPTSANYPPAPPSHATHALNIAPLKKNLSRDPLAHRSPPMPMYHLSTRP